MKRNTSLLIITLCFVLNPGFAQNFIKGFQSVEEMVSMAGILYFIPDDGIHGKELWRSDGTLEGTFLVKDISQASQGANPTHLIVYKNEIYFAANDDLHGTELWKSNGTEEGTVMVANIKPDTEPYNNGSLPSDFILYNNLLFFTASDDGNDSDIWKTNGTNIGTVKVYETNSINVGELTVVDDDLFFVYYYGPRQLWSYNDISGIAAEIFVDDYYEIAELNSISGTLYFITNTTNRQDIRLYKLTTDKTLTLITEYTHPPYGSIDIDNFTEVNQEVFFSVRTNFDNDPATDVLWKTDGTPEGTVELKTFDWVPYLYQSYMGGFIQYHGNLYFRSGEENGCTLWKSDGTASGTIQISGTRLNKEYGKLTISDDWLFYCGGLGNNELWFSDGTEEGTMMFADLNSYGHSNPSNLCDVSGTLYFTANDGYSLALWNNKPNPEITIKTGSNQIEPNETISFSEIKVDSVEVKKLVIENTGLKELVISKITVSGRDFHIRNQKNIILPKEKDTLFIYFFPASEGHRTGQITISNNDNNEASFMIKLDGTAEGFITVPSIADYSTWLDNEINFGNTGDTIFISKYSIDENLPANTIVGTLGIAGENVLDWSFSLVAGIGDEDNTSFFINNNSVYSAKKFDYEVQNTYAIRIKATKNTGIKSHEQYFVIQINDQNETITYDACGKTFYNLMYALNDVEFVGYESVFAVGDDGVILKSTDAGESWDQINSGTRATLYEIQFVTENVGYIVGYEDIVLKTDNGGNNWFPIEINNPGYPYVMDLFFVTADKGFVVGDEGKIFRTNDGGRTWDYHSEGFRNFNTVYFVNESLGFVCGRSNILFRTSDFGDSWTQIDMENFGWNLWFKDICFTNEQTGYMISSDGDVLKTVDAGISWALINNLSTDYATNICFVNENEGYIIGGWTGSTFFKTQDAGITWQEIDIDGFSSLSGISLNPTGEKGCVVGDAAGYGSSSASGRVILCSVDNGNTWSKTNYINGNRDYKDVAFFDNNIGYVFGGDYYSGGIAHKTFDGGITWQQLPVPPLNSYSTGVRKCYFINQDTIFAFSDSAYLTTDGGFTWESKNEFNRNSQYHFIDYDTIYRLDGFSDAIVYKSVNAGETWELINNSGNWLTHISFYNENIGFLLGYSVILKTEDGGETWSEYSHNLSQILNTIIFIDENIILIGGNEGTLMKSIDAGETWTIIPSIIKTNIIDIDFFDQNNGIILANNDGGLSNVYSTSDGGETWNFVMQISEDTYKAFVNNNAETFIIGNSGTFLKYGQILPPSQAGYIVGDEFVCSGEIVDYKTPESDYFDYLWNIDNNQPISSDNNKATVTWDEPGEYVMELTPINACGVGLPQTLMVHVEPLPIPEIAGNDTITNLELSVIYTSNEYDDDRIMWSLDGADSASVLNDREIFVKWKNSNGYIELIQTTAIGCRQKTTKEISYTIGIIELTQDCEINVFPNPTSDFIYFNSPTSNSVSYTLTLFDSIGRRMSINELSGPQSSLYVGNLPVGIYLLNISSKMINKTVRVIID